MPEIDIPQPIIIGCGFLGTYLATLLLDYQQSPACIVQSHASHTKLAKDNFQAIVHDLDRSAERAEFILKDRQIY